MSNPDLWRAVIAQAVVDACYILDDPQNYGRHGGNRQRRIRRNDTHAQPTRLESFIAWRWLWDAKYQEDREMVFEYAGMEDTEFVPIFANPQKHQSQIRTLRSGARRVLREDYLLFPC